MSYDDGKYMGFKCSSMWNALHVCNLRCFCLSNEYEKIVGGFVEKDMFACMRNCKYTVVVIIISLQYEYTTL